uniref:RNase H type-1 domain-containing protein n=1 Tax=Timema genevievae TaxID=629358 RepID=A0A7R9K4C7_TIMGE|nr:unnamed protein product [Timema genevievae]
MFPEHVQILYALSKRTQNNSNLSFQTLPTERIQFVHIGLLLFFGATQFSQRGASHNPSSYSNIDSSAVRWWSRGLVETGQLGPEWEACKEQVDKFPNPKYKKFSTLEEATKFVEEFSVTKPPATSFSAVPSGAFLSSHGSKSCTGLGLAAKTDGGGWLSVPPSMSFGITAPSHAPVASLPGDNTVEDIFSLEQKALTLETLFKDTARKLASEIKSVKKSCKDLRKGVNGAGTDSVKLRENLSQKLATFETDYKTFESTLWRDLIEVKEMVAQLNGAVGKVERLSARDKIASMVKPMTPGAVLMANKRSFSTSTATSSKGSDTVSVNESYKRLLSEDDDIICLAESAHKSVKTEPAETSVTDSPVSLQFQLDQQGFVQVYTDGACEKNGFAGAKAGIGVWFGINHPLNTSEPVRGRATNNTAEIQAAILAIELAKSAGVKKLCINTDSQFLINSITKWIRKWRRNNWKLTDGGPVKNKEDFVTLDAAMKSVVVKWLPKLASGQVIRTGMKTALLLSVQCHTREDCKCDKTLQPVQVHYLLNVECYLSRYIPC